MVPHKRMKLTLDDSLYLYSEITHPLESPLSLFHHSTSLSMKRYTVHLTYVVQKAYKCSISQKSFTMKATIRHPRQSSSTHKGKICGCDGQSLACRTPVRNVSPAQSNECVWSFDSFQRNWA